MSTLVSTNKAYLVKLSMKGESKKVQKWSTWFVYDPSSELRHHHQSTDVVLLLILSQKLIDLS